MKRNRIKWIVFLLLGAVTLAVSAGLLSGSQTGMYRGRILVAGHGGHIADAEIVIDPTASADTIRIPNYTVWTGNKLHFIPLGDAADYASHDVRIDNQDPNTAFWSNYTSKKPSVLVGKVDLRTHRWTAERRLDLPKEVLDFGKTTTKTLYCASGQTEKYFLPIFMGYPGFIDVIDKKDLSLKRRVMMASNPELPTNYTYTHGISSPDNKFLFIAMNDASKPHGDVTGVQHFFMLDLPTLVEKGEIKILRKNTIPFREGTVSFRSTFTPDGKHILQAGRTRVIVLNASDLSLVQDSPIPEGMENHDVLPTPDGRYAVSLVRVPVDSEGRKVTDGQIWLYDIAANKHLGNPVSTCRQCHLKHEKHAPLTWGMEIAGCTRCHMDKRTVMNVMNDSILCGADALLSRN